MCGYQCHEIGSTFISENPECPVHGRNGLDPCDAREVIRKLCDMLASYADPEHLQVDELIRRARLL